jgi:hypothetical protein
MTPLTRKYDGEIYELVAEYRKREDAENYAHDLRMRGSFIRIQAIGKGLEKIHAVYGKPGRIPGRPRP